MALIKPWPRGRQIVKHFTQLDHHNHATLDAYAQFMDEITEHVLPQGIEIVLARDKEFRAVAGVHGVVRASYARPAVLTPPAERVVSTGARRRPEKPETSQTPARC